MAQTTGMSSPGQTKDQEPRGRKDKEMCILLQHKGRSCWKMPQGMVSEADHISQYQKKEDLRSSTASLARLSRAKVALYAGTRQQCRWPGLHLSPQ